MVYPGVYSPVCLSTRVYPGVYALYASLLGYTLVYMPPYCTTRVCTPLCAYRPPRPLEALSTLTFSPFLPLIPALFSLLFPFIPVCDRTGGPAP